MAVIMSRNINKICSKFVANRAVSNKETLYKINQNASPLEPRIETSQNPEKETDGAPRRRRNNSVLPLGTF